MWRNGSLISGCHRPCPKFFSGTFLSPLPLARTHHRTFRSCPARLIKLLRKSALTPSHRFHAQACDLTAEFNYPCVSTYACATIQATFFLVPPRSWYNLLRHGESRLTLVVPPSEHYSRYCHHHHYCHAHVLSLEKKLHL